MEDTLAILDAGAQYAKVIDRKIRELNVKTDIKPIDTPASELKEYKAIVISGGPESVYNEKIQYDKALFEIGIPVLGICFGMQMLAFCTNGKVEKKAQREDGQFKVKVLKDCKLFDGMEEEQIVLLTHGDSVISVGSGYRVVGYSGSLITAIACDDKKLFGVQFHPEVDLTENGKDIFKNFLFKIAGFKGTFTTEDRKEVAIKYIKERLKDKKVLVLASGGVDSTVCTALLNEALGHDRVIPLHINNGFMRKDESSKVAHALENIGIKLITVDASEEFYNGVTEVENLGIKKHTLKLNQTVNPEEKRKIIGDTFMRVAQREISKLGLGVDDIYLAQGTLRPDIIESGSPDVSKSAHTIKTHHNDTNIVRQLRSLGKIVEPLSEYHKDEVRKLGQTLNLPADILNRHPFPGPGLAVRIICSTTPFIGGAFDETNTFLECLVGYPKSGSEKINEDIMESIKEDEKVLLEEIRKESSISATLLPIKTVGVQGDCRSYNHPCALFSSSEPNWNHLFMLSKYIPRVQHNVNRVVYIYGPPIKGPINTITPTHLTPDVISELQEADDIVTNVLVKTGTMSKVSQVPVILVPIGFEKGTHSVVIRTMITNDFMTGRAAIPNKDIDENVIKTMVSEIEKLPNISRVAYDLTSKPPGTTEWE